ncbi:MAG: glycoside hydrolase family 20 zincin-like fold domain-containing protein, partial [Cyclobacteriaceae bacterium]
MKRYCTLSGFLVLFFLLHGTVLKGQVTGLFRQGIHVIPYPQEVETLGQPFIVPAKISIVTERNAPAEDRFTAEQLVRSLKEEFDIEGVVSNQASRGSITLSRKRVEKRLGPEGYELTSSPDGISVAANGSAGLFYGTQTLLQLIKKEGSSYSVPGLK